MTGEQAAEPVRAYHQRTKHRLDRYAAGPGSLDWDAQPDPFRAWSGTRKVALPRAAESIAVSWDELAAARPPAPLNREGLGNLLQLCAAITAWKEYAGSRWALRANPSSGNLHPTETWVVARGVEGLADGLYHYQPRDHSLELRAAGGQAGAPGAWLTDKMRPPFGGALSKVTVYSPTTVPVAGSVTVASHSLELPVAGTVGENVRVIVSVVPRGL